jgi:hypothetical protein
MSPSPWPLGEKLALEFEDFLSEVKRPLRERASLLIYHFLYDSIFRLNSWNYPGQVLFVF